MWIICLKLPLILCNHEVSCSFIILFSLKVRQSRIWLTEVISKQEIHRPTIKWSSGMYLNLSCTLESFIYSLACMIFSNIHTIPIQSQQRETWSLKLNLQSNNPLFIPPPSPFTIYIKLLLKKIKITNGHVVLKTNMKMKNSWHRMNEDEWRQTAIGHNLKVLKWYTTDHSAFCLVRLEWITYM